MNGPKKLPAQNALSLWHLLTIMSGSVELGASWSAVNNLDLGRSLTLVVMSISLALAAGCIVAIRTLGDRMTRGLERDSRGMVSKDGERRLSIIYGLAAVWIPASGILGFQMVSIVSSVANRSF